MLQIPASTISKISFSNTSRSSATRRVLAVGNSPSTVAGSPATTAPAAPQAASAAATQIVTVTVNPWHAGNTTSTSGTGQRPSTAASNTGQGRQAAAADIGQGPLTAASAARLLGSTDLAQSQANLGFAVTTVIQAYRVGVCGNGVCEVGERALNSSSGAGLLGSCPADCPGPYADCPSNGSLACSGKGQCLTNQGMCNCYPG